MDRKIILKMFVYVMLAMMAISFAYLAGFPLIILSGMVLFIKSLFSGILPAMFILGLISLISSVQAALCFIYVKGRSLWIFFWRAFLSQLFLMIGFSVGFVLFLATAYGHEKAWGSIFTFFHLDLDSAVKIIVLGTGLIMQTVCSVFFMFRDKRELLISILLSAFWLTALCLHGFHMLRPVVG